LSIVFDNIAFNLQRAGGISRFWSKIIDPYKSSPDARFIEHVGGGENIYRRQMALSASLQDHRLPVWIARYLNFSRRFFKEGFVFHSSYFRVNSAPGCANITTVHDLIYEKFGGRLGSPLHVIQKKTALRKSDCIVCVSDYTRKDLLEYYPFCSDKRVIVIPNGVDGFYPFHVDADLFHRLNLKDDGSYFLYVGHRGSCKGFALIHDALDLLEGALQCVVVGSPFNQAELTEISKRGHQSKILHAGKVNDSELNCLYSHARFFFFPSLYEGFGIPPLEAMMSGCPVLASNRSSVPEVVNDAGVLFDPSDLGTLKNGLLRILQAEARKDLISRGLERASRFSWRSVVERYATLYSEFH